MKGIRRWFRIRSVERDVDEEISFHFAELVRELEREGWSPQAAHEEASRQFGDEHYYRRQLVSIDRSVARQERWTQRLEGFRDTLRYAVRGVVRSPALSFGIVLAFALGIGANATMYETVERMLLRPPAHIADPDDVRRILVHRLAGTERVYAETVTYADYAEDFAGTRGFAAVAAHRMAPLTLGTGESAEQVQTVRATASYWPLLGVQPALGRFFTEDEDRIGGDAVAVLSYARWQHHYGGSPDALGQTVDFGHGPYTIIGVTPRGFLGADLSPVDFFLPFMVASEGITAVHFPGMPGQWVKHRGWYGAQVLARLDPAVPVAAAEAEATTRHRAGRAETPWYDTEARVVAAPLLAARGPNAPTEVTVAKWLLGVAAVVLTIACLNVSNLLLARMLRQRREIAIRLALGIPRSRLILQMMAEGVLLGLLGGAAALVLASWGGTFVQNTLLPDIDWTAGPSATLLLLVLTVSVLAGALSALVPALQASRRDVAGGLRSAGGGLTPSTARTRATLTMVQAALSVLLLVGAGLFVRSLDRIHTTDFGLSFWDLAVVMPTFYPGTVSGEDRWQYFEQARAQTARLPGVTGASVVSGIPLLTPRRPTIRAQGVDSVPGGPTGGRQADGPYGHAVDGEYFRTAGMRLAQGRLFNERDTRHSPPVIVLNAAFAQALWPGESPLGRCLYVGPTDACREIIGVVGDARLSNLVEEPAFQYFMHLEQRPLSSLSWQPDALLVRIAGDMAPTLAAVQRAVVATDGRVRFARVQPLEELVAGELRQWRLAATMFSLFGLLALLVAALGLYSVLAFDVAQRVREIGLRTALGASTASIMSLIMYRALRITAAGIAMGLILALALAPRLQDLLYRISPRDPVTFTVVVVTLCAVSILAAGVPAWRAARVDPNVALKAE
jgi:predicted permease